MEWQDSEQVHFAEASRRFTKTVTCLLLLTFSHIEICCSLTIAYQYSYDNSDVIHRSVFYMKYNLSETRFCSRLQVKPTQMALLD
jgi:hypothetical protein